MPSKANSPLVATLLLVRMDECNLKILNDCLKKKLGNLTPTLNLTLSHLQLLKPDMYTLSLCASLHQQELNTRHSSKRKIAQNKPFTKLSLTHLNTLQSWFNDMSGVLPESLFLAEMRLLQSHWGVDGNLSGGHYTYRAALVLAPAGRVSCACRCFGHCVKGLLRLKYVKLCFFHLLTAVVTLCRAVAKINQPNSRVTSSPRSPKCAWDVWIKSWTNNLEYFFLLCVQSKSL